jgi:hypothetical protein
MAGMLRRTAALGTAVALAITGAGTVSAALAARAAESPAFLSWRFIYRGGDNADFETVSAVNQRDAWVAADLALERHELALGAGPGCPRLRAFILRRIVGQ